jgi:uncharacterized protein YqgC (DUF456 family)
MKIAMLDRAFTVLMLGLGIFVMISAWSYGLYRNNVPGPGFFPMVGGVLITVLSAAILVRDLSGRLRVSGEIPWPIVGAVIGLTLMIAAFVFVAPYVGMAIACFVMMVVVGYISEEDGKRTGRFPLKLVGASLATVIVCHLLFGVLIRVPLLEGPLGF